MEEEVIRLMISIILQYMLDNDMDFLSVESISEEISTGKLALGVNGGNLELAVVEYQRKESDLDE